MFGLADKIFLRKCGTTNPRYDPIKMQSNLKKPGPVWVCFIPARSFDNNMLRKRYLPQNSSYIAFRLPSEFVKIDPHKTRVTLDKILDFAFKAVKKCKFKEIN